MWPSAPTEKYVRQCLRRCSRSCRRRLGLAHLTQTPQLAFLQDFCQVNHDDEPATKLAHPGDVIQFTFVKDVGWQIDVCSRKLQHFGSGIHDQTDHLSLNFDYQDAVLFASRNLFFAKTLAQVE